MFNEKGNMGGGKDKGINEIEGNYYEERNLRG